MELKKLQNGFEVVVNNKVVLHHSVQQPMLYVGYGEEDISMYRGNFKIEDYVVERVALKNADVTETKNGFTVDFDGKITADFAIKDDVFTVNFKSNDEKINRFWLRVNADKDEKVYGCGEQFTYFNLRGKHFPLWTSEPGVGRNKNTYVTWRSDVENGGAGGDYYHTYFPQTTYVSSNKYYLHVDTTAYADFDFRHDSYHELQFWTVPNQIRIECADTYLKLLTKLTGLLGRLPELPDWVYNGLVIGVQGGTERSFGLLDRTLEHDIPVAGMWCQDWEGIRVTSFGKRLRWNWLWNEELYPNLPEKIKDMESKNMKFMGYINPYLLREGSLCEEAAKLGYLVKNPAGEDYYIDFGEFDCGIPDLTNPEAFEWFKDCIKKNLIDFGLAGWMADFGEYLPTDAVLHNGVSAMIEHNHWPALWAKCNYEAVKEAGKLGEIVYFMRAGGTGSQKWCPLMWAGDQSVDFTIDDGLASAICATLSVGMVGCTISHSDIGGYTSLFDNCRTKELFDRWTEMAAFTPFMRTHESNRPDTNFQYYDDEDTMKHLSRFVKIYKALAPYTKSLVKQASEEGIPVQRPLFLHYEDDSQAYDIKYQYMFGSDILVAPVYTEGADSVKAYLPNDKWIHLWTGEEYTGGWHEISAPMGKPAVFYKADSQNKALFESLKNI